MSEEAISINEDFSRALRERAPAYGVGLNEYDRLRLTDYYLLLMKWNRRLHLVAPCLPDEFATRHVLESLLLLPHLPRGARIVDIGSGAGLPILPCLIVRRDLEATLVEASAKKAVFLREAISQLGCNARVVAERFETTSAPQAQFVTCRALERFQEMLPRLIAWSPASATLLLFGGQNLREQFEKLNLQFTARPIPNSERRFLFILRH
jgi:16S rRNA (guanine527-N7)-methyltransferase